MQIGYIVKVITNQPVNQLTSYKGNKSNSNPHKGGSIWRLLALFGVIVSRCYSNGLIELCNETD
ncbi:TPA: hypothetical protein JRX35_003500 [Elizabethkingia anophelis]|nr:hypothetical protein [Elizabethkingia anophelis]HAY3541057.1 hypothetical protein [Elizabethkingia anophelis]